MISVNYLTDILTKRSTKLKKASTEWKIHPYTHPGQGLRRVFNGTYDLWTVNSSGNGLSGQVGSSV